MTQKSATVACINNNNLLLLRRGSTAKWKAGMYCLPGGKLEKDESLKDGALRELFEETGIVTYRDSLTPVTIDYEVGYSKIVFVTNLDHRDVTLNWEHDDYIWIGADEMAAYPLVPGLPTTIKTLVGHGYLS
jgi:8-oxo-dGTP pyrophosphatase MutT (NUDIX family)